MSDVLQLIERLEQATAAAREATREAHEARKDLRAAIREAKDEIRSLLRDDLGARMETQVQDQLAELVKTTRKAMDASVAKVAAEFDKLARIYLGLEDGQEPLEELVRRAARARHAKQGGAQRPIRCPHCGIVNEEHDADDPKKVPKPGDAAVCWSCKKPSMFDLDDAAALILRLPTPTERLDLLKHPQAASARHAVHEAGTVEEAIGMLRAGGASTGTPHRGAP